MYKNSDMTLGQRLREARKEAKLSQKDLAQRVKIKQPTLSDLENDVSKGSSAIASIAAALGVNTLWLAEGRGPKKSGQTIQNVELAASGGRRVPVISYVQAGLMVEVVDPFSLGGGFEIIEVSMPCSARTFALRIRGNSMEPRFYEGDLAIIDPELTPKPGQFVVAKNTSEEATFKKYRPRGLDERGNDVFELVPLNDDYPTLHSERDHLHIIGVCIERRENMLR